MKPPFWVSLPVQRRRKEVETGVSLFHYIDMNQAVTNARFNFDGDILRVITAPRGMVRTPTVRFDRANNEPWPLFQGVVYKRKFRDLFFTVPQTPVSSEDVISGDQYVRMFIGSAGHDLEWPDYAVRQRAFFSSRILVGTGFIFLLRSDRGLASPNTFTYGWNVNAVTMVNRGPQNVLVETGRQHDAAGGAIGILEPGDCLDFVADEFANQTGLALRTLAGSSTVDVWQVR